MKTESITVSFRVDAELRKQMDDQCRRFGTSRGDWARGVVLAHLEAGDQTQLMSHFESLQLQLDELAQDTHRQGQALKRMTLALLTAPRELSADEARIIAAQLFRS